MKPRILFLCIVFGLFEGCTGFAIKRQLFGNYYLVATDGDEGLSLTYHGPNDGNTYGDIVPATVFAIGYNDSFMIIKQHPRTFPNPPNRNVTNYFILPIKKDFNYRTMNEMIGPISFEQFTQKRRELGIPDSLSFSIKYEKLD
jgi:hypothetical protein